MYNIQMMLMDLELVFQLGVWSDPSEQDYDQDSWLSEVKSKIHFG